MSEHELELRLEVSNPLETCGDGRNRIRMDAAQFARLTEQAIRPETDRAVRGHARTSSRRETTPQPQNVEIACSLHAQSGWYGRGVPPVDVVVVSYNSSETLRGCVEPLCAGEGSVIVVDNASRDRSLETIGDLPVDAVALQTNLGFGHGCNVGWKRGSSPAVLFLNPDARIEPASIARLADVLSEGSDAGIVGPRIVDEHGSLDYSIRRFPRLSSTYAQALFLHRLTPRADWVDEVVRDESRYAVAGEAEWVSGACMLVRRSVLETLGGFDEGFFLYCEDKDLCRRAWDAGCTVRYEPAAQALHVGGVSAPRGELLPVLAASRIRYAHKHERGWRPAAERVGVAVGGLTHALLGRGDRVVRKGHARAALRALRFS